MTSPLHLVTPAPSSTELIDRALRGEAAAIDALVDDLFPVIRARVRRRLQRVIAASELEDVVQDVWVKLVADGGKKLRGYDPNRGASLANYVGLIAEREAANHLAALQTQKRGHGLVRAELVEDGDDATSDGVQPSMERAIADRQVLAKLLEHLDGELPPKGRVVFQFVYCDERSVDEVAGALGVSAQVVYNWQHKIRTIARAFCARLGV